MMTSICRQFLSEQIAEIFGAFSYGHLTPTLQEVSRPFYDLARQVAGCPASAQTLFALQYLLVAKDAAVRAAL